MRDCSDSEILGVLDEVKGRFGRLIVAHVYYVTRVQGDMSISALAQYLGVSRGAVRSALQELSNTDT